MSKNSFTDSSTLMNFWEKFKLETLNQKICRMILGVHKKSSRLGVLGELGRYPLFLKAICHTLKYQAQICKNKNSSLISRMVSEIKNMPTPDLTTWWGRVEQIKSTLGIKYSPHAKIEIIGQQIKKQVKSKFDAFYLTEINKIKLGNDLKNHNKLRFYSSIKGCFKKEPYIDLIPNRAQRADLTRLRISSSRLAVEVLRYKKVPEERRYCQYCTPTGVDNNLEGHLDNEQHFLTSCSSFTLKRNCLFSKLDTVITGFIKFSSKEKTAILLCPTSVLTAKLSNKYIQIMFKTRQLLDDGFPAFNDTDDSDYD